MWKFFFSFAVLLIALIYNRKHLYCVDHVENVERFLATKSPYGVGEGQDYSHPTNCTAVQIWALIRHGTRNPSGKIIREMNRVLPGIRDRVLIEGRFCPETIKKFQKWRPKLEEKDEKKLVEKGRVEIRGIARRLKQRFPFIVSNRTKFQFTKTERTEQSFKHFALELGNVNKDTPAPEHAHPVLRFYKNCNKWRTTVKKNPKALIEKQNFETIKSDILKSNIFKKTGLNLSFEEISTVYTACSFETAWDTISPWCAFFTEEDLDILSYRQDLHYYYVDGYGHEINYVQACRAVGDFLESVGKKVKGEESPDLVAYFTHSGTILKFISRLGLFKEDVHLRHDNYDEKKNRKWRTSEIDTFSSNFIGVTYRCEKKYKVQFLYQERPIDVPNCGRLCEYGEFVELFKNNFDCDLRGICE